MREANQRPNERPNRARAMAGALVFGAALICGAAPVSAGEAAASSAEAEFCEASEAVDVNAAAAELMRQIAQEQAQSGRNAEAEADFVVLNNRGYNYGPPPGVRFDPIVDGAPADPHAQ